ncbi:MAG TPA: DHH family phosphoesterase [Candidatus Scatovivens faecipullorum]|nr:DHH family phosphoesterase [Candidatus Scatovivens faecipullorum]
MPNSNGKILDKLTSKNIIYILIIGFLCIALCVYDLSWIIPSIALFAIIVAYTIWVTSKKRTEIENHIQDITSDVSTASKGNLINTPIPLVLVETDGNIVWRSKKFVEEFQNIDIRTYLVPIVKEIKLDIEKNNDEAIEITKQFNIDKKVYKIRGSVLRAKRREKKRQKEYTVSLYFIDETKYNELFDLYNKSKTCIGIAMIDNYEELIQRILPEKKIELLAKIEKEIIEWITRTGGLIIKTERDHFAFVFEQQYLSEFEKERFNILDKVKTIELDDGKIPITLSIAVSNDGKNNYEKYKSALTAMDIVLGRGGDQAVVRKNGKYKFYGGKTLEVEKRTKVKARTISQSISKAILESDNVVIMGHKNIDIDAIGSALGLYRLSKTLEKECYIISEPQGKSLEKFLDNLQKLEQYKGVIISEEDSAEIIKENTLLIVVDTHKTSYVEFPDILDKIERKIVIDHHRKAPDCIENTLVSFHEVYASSTAELVTEIVQYAQDNVELTLIEAESLYGGIMVDTKDFTFKTGVRTFEAAAYLRKYGVDIIRVKKWFQADLESYNKIANIVRNVEIHNDTIAIAIYDEENENGNLICAKAADELLTISDITASFVMTKIGEKVFISGRSIGDINVQVILEKLGGGGHITLAGAQLEGVSVEKAKEDLIEKIEEYLAETE